MSLIVHPAPRMTTAPTAKRPIRYAGVDGGRWWTVDAKVIPQAGVSSVCEKYHANAIDEDGNSPPGQYSNKDPIGLSIRIKCK